MRRPIAELREEQRRIVAAQQESAVRGDERHAHVDHQLEDLSERLAAVEAALAAHQAEKGSKAHKA